MKKKDRNEVAREELQQEMQKYKDNQRIQADRTIGNIKSVIETINALKYSKESFENGEDFQEDFQKKQEITAQVHNLSQQISQQEQILKELKEQLYWILRNKEPAEFKKEKEEYYAMIEKWFEEKVNGVLL